MKSLIKNELDAAFVKIIPEIVMATKLFSYEIQNVCYPAEYKEDLIKVLGPLDDNFCGLKFNDIYAGRFNTIEYKQRIKLSVYSRTIGHSQLAYTNSLQNIVTKFRFLDYTKNWHSWGTRLIFRVLVKAEYGGYQAGQLRYESDRTYKDLRSRAVYV